jgi:hypothetical protein
MTKLKLGPITEKSRSRPRWNCPPRFTAISPPMPSCWDRPASLCAIPSN